MSYWGYYGDGNFFGAIDLVGLVGDYFENNKIGL